MTWHVSFSRIMRAGSRNLFRNAWLSTAAAVVMTVTLSVILLSFVANIALTDTIKGIVNKIDISVYLADTTTKPQIIKMGQDLRGLDNVEEVNFVSKTDALARYREQNKDNPLLLEAVNEQNNPLNASFEIKVRDQNKLDPISAFVARPEVKKLLDPITPTSYSGERKATIDKIIRSSNFIRTFGLIASLLFVTISTLIIFNTIRMAIFTRREEIEIMRLVGATNWFIRGPFLFEAALYGIIAAVIATVVVYSLVTAPSQLLAKNFDMVRVNHLFHSSPHLILLGELGLGAVIGMGSSLLAMSRYLKL